MNRILKILPLLGILVFLGLSAPAPAAASVGWGVSFSTFDGALSPYGTWVTVGTYGRGWRPSRVSVGWQPYSNGEWLYTDYGWSWVSYDPWGAYPYHYGSWVYEPGYGWVWIPGYVWAPAWVTWCYSDSFIGWAPLSPGFYLTTSGYFGGAVVAPASSYVFVPTNRFVGVNASTARISPTRNATFLNSGTKTTRFSVANGIVRTSGPDPRRIERITHKTIRPTSASRANLHPTRVDAGGNIRGSRVALTSRAGEKAIAPRLPKRGGAATMERRPVAHRQATGHPKSTIAHRNVVPKSSSHPQPRVARNVAPKSSSHPQPRVARDVAPKSSSHPQPRVAMTQRHETPHVERHVASRSQPPPIVRQAPAPRAEPRIEAHAAPRMESRPAFAPRAEARHAQPAPRGSKRQDSR